jgi:hypothetical protein
MHPTMVARTTGACHCLSAVSSSTWVAVNARDDEREVAWMLYESLSVSVLPDTLPDPLGRDAARAARPRRRAGLLLRQPGVIRAGRLDVASSPSPATDPA